VAKQGLKMMSDAFKMAMMGKMIGEGMRNEHQGGRGRRAIEKVAQGNQVMEPV